MALKRSKRGFAHLDDRIDSSHALLVREIKIPGKQKQASFGRTISTWLRPKDAQPKAPRHVIYCVSNGNSLPGQAPDAINSKRAHQFR